MTANEEETMRTLTLLILAFTCSIAAAQVYTWRDASGKVHYSDTPPPGVDARKMRAGTQEAAAPSSNAPSRSLAEKDMNFRKRKDEADNLRAKGEKDRLEAEEAKRNCEQARSQLAALESGQRMNRFDASGERVPLDDEMRAQEIERTKKIVQSWCK